MKTRILCFFVLPGLLSLTLLTSCGGGKSTDKQAAVQTANAPSAEQMALGKSIYEAKCKLCHQSAAQGLPPVWPPLAGSDYLLGDKKRAVAQALNGSNKDITVNGVVFKGLMPPQVGTADSAVAVINYVLNNFGNNGGYISADEVKDIVINPR